MKTKKPTMDELKRKFYESIGKENVQHIQNDDRAFQRIKQNKEYEKMRDDLMDKLGL